MMIRPGPRLGLYIGIALGTLAAAAVAAGATAVWQSSNADCGYAFVYPLAIGTNQSEQDIQQGLRKAKTTFKISITEVENTTDSALEDNIRALAAKKCYRAIGTAFFNYGQQIANVAKDFPEQTFFINGGPSMAPNVLSYDYRYEEGTFVAGAMAAKLSKTGKIGILVGLAIPTLNRFKNGLIAGVHYIAPKDKVFTGVVGSFTDPAKGATLAIAQASQGVDVIYPATGSNLEIMHQAKRHHYKTIGSDFVETALAARKGYPPTLVVAADQAGTAFAVMRDIVNRKPTTGTRLLGLKDGVFGIPYLNHGHVLGILKPSPAVLAAGRKAYQAIATGKVKIKNPTA